MTFQYAQFIGIACWFDVCFNGSENLVRLSTSPREPATHWYQCRLLLPQPIAVNRTQIVSGLMKMVANERKSYTISLTSKFINRKFRNNSDNQIRLKCICLQTYTFYLIMNT